MLCDESNVSSSVSTVMPQVVISPELALVSPELAQAARLRLPDRPWEVTARQAPASAPRRVDVAPVPSAVGFPGRPTADQAAAAIPLPPTRAEADQIRRLAMKASAVAEARGEARRRARRLFALTAALGVFVVIVGALWERGGNEARAPTRRPVAEAPRQSAGKTAMPLLASAGYVVQPDGGFLTSPSGRVIESFTLPIRCGSRQLVIRDIPVRGRSLQFAGEAVRQTATVRLRARIIDRMHVRGVVIASGARCNTDRVEFSARLS